MVENNVLPVDVVIVVDGMCGYCRVISLVIGLVSVLGLLCRKCPACLNNVDFVTVYRVR